MKIKQQTIKKIQFFLIKDKAERPAQSCRCDRTPPKNRIYDENPTSTHRGLPRFHLINKSIRD